jgi:hypothetical protein
MTKGFLSSYFKGVAAKYLSAVETRPETSNQHEFNGISSLKAILGEARHTFPTKLVYLGSDENEILSAESELTWYDARENHPTRTEYRLYFQTNSVLEQAQPGDLLIIGLRSDDTLFVIVARANTTYESQILWLFPLDNIGIKFNVKRIEDKSDVSLNFAIRYIFDELGIQVKEEADDLLDQLIKEFGKSFPTTRHFSAFARKTFGEADVLQRPDETLVNWIDHEEMLFRTFEKHLVSERLKKGFVNDVDEFINFSLSVQNRRKSRAGYALENHLEFIFQERNLLYSRGEITELRAKPDFIFPGISYYHDPKFSVDLLTMLGVKSTCKERWRQVLSEAARIENKHLFTLEPAISINQTNEMKSSHLQLVVPSELHLTYQESQRGWLLDLSGFLEIVKNRQAAPIIR